MNIAYRKQSTQKLERLGYIISTIVCIAIVAISAAAQTTVDLPQLVLEAKHTEYVQTRNPGTPNIINVKSSNPSVAKADVYRVDRVQIIAVAPGSTNVEFFDAAQRVLYKILIWVTAPNSTGGGGTGYNPRLTQLAQIIMLVNRTENAHTPNDRAARISGVTSSNPSVATARTDPPRGIQIYSKALGDTWVNFTNNATGITYQVHVWVTNDPKLIPPSPGPSAESVPKPKPKPNPNSKPMPFPGPGLRDFDRCLIGTWRSDTQETFYDGSVVMNVTAEGLTFIVRPDATATFDYSGVKPVVRRSAYGGTNSTDTVTTTVTGSATARIGDNRNHNIIAEDGTLRSNVTFTESYSNGTAPRVVKHDESFFFSEQTTTYTSCSANTLVIGSVVPITFRKVN